MAKLNRAKIIGYILIAVLVMYLVTMYFKEGFENIITQFTPGKPLTEMCPKGNALVLQMVQMGNSAKDTIVNGACYPEGTTNVKSVFQGDNKFVSLMAPKGYTIRLYSDTDAKGKVIYKLSDLSENNDCMDTDVNKKFNCITGMNKIPALVNAKFSSIKVSSEGRSRDPYDDRDGRYSRDRYDDRDGRYSRESYDTELRYSRQPYHNRDTIASRDYSCDNEEEEEEC
jgi:hypothetical protein